MRIGLSCTTIEPRITHGQIDGIGTYTKNLYETFKEKGNKVVPFSFFKNRERVSFFDEGKIFHYSYGFSTIASFIKPFSSFLYKGIEKEIDIFHSTDHMIPRLKTVPVIATLHDALMFKKPEWYPSQGNTLRNWLRKKTLAWPNHFITISTSMVKELVQYCYVPEDKITVIHNGISPWWLETVSEEEKDSTLKKFAITKNFLLFASTLQPKKNVARLIQAYLKLPQDIQEAYPLVVVGRKGFEAKESLKAIQQLRDQKRGIWLNYVTQEELRCLLQSASLYLHPSLHEGFGLTLLEAFASHTPILTSNITAIPEIVGDAAYQVDPYSVQDISDGIKKLLTSPAYCKILSEKGRERVKQFSWEVCARKTLEVYRKILCPATNSTIDVPRLDS